MFPKAHTGPTLALYLSSLASSRVSLFFHCSATLASLLFIHRTHQANFCLKAFACCSFCLKCFFFRYIHGLFPHRLHIFFQMLPSQVSFPWLCYLKLQITSSIPHSSFTFLPCICHFTLHLFHKIVCDLFVLLVFWFLAISFTRARIYVYFVYWYMPNTHGHGQLLVTGCGHSEPYLVCLAQVPSSNSGILYISNGQSKRKK